MRLPDCSRTVVRFPGIGLFLVRSRVCSRLCTWFAGLFIIRVGVFCVVGVWPFVCEDLCFGFGPWCLWSLDPWALSLFNVQVSVFLAYWMWGALGLLA